MCFPVNPEIKLLNFGAFLANGATQSFLFDGTNHKMFKEDL
jgi:hypothetical protein